MKPMVHSQSSVKKFGGVVSDYLRLHDFLDQTKSHFPTNAHRAILHSSFGIFLGEQVFGHEITNSDGKQVSVRDIFEQHICEDLGFIPTVSDYLQFLEYQNWMHGDGLPPSLSRKVEKQELPKVQVPTSGVRLPKFSENEIIDDRGIKILQEPIKFIYYD